jgi:beta-glucanase (GH16 family)
VCLLGLGLGAVKLFTGASATGHSAPSPSVSGSLTRSQAQATSGPAIFEDHFTRLDPTKWNTFLTSRASAGGPWDGDGAGGSNGSAQYNADYFLPSQVTADHGLVIAGSEQPTPGRAYQLPVTLPWRDGVVSSYGKFEFTGGYVQVTAKLPSGNGLWPAFWMLPGPGGTRGDDYEIDMFEGGFIGNGVPATHNHAWHVIVDGKSYGGVTDIGTDLTSSYHVYGLDWMPGRSLTWYLDGRQVGQLTSATCPIADEPMELILGLSVANAETTAWHTTYDESTPRSVQLLITDVRVDQG